MISKTLLAVSVMGIFLLASGKAMAVPFSSAPYFPLTASKNWVYQVDDVTPPNTTITVNPTLVNIGVDTTRLDTSSTTSTNGSMTFNTSDGDGIRLHRRFAPNGVDCGVPRNLTLTFSPPVIFANGMTDIGSIANTAGDAEAVITVCGTSSLSYTASFTVNGFETVTVPAGIFDVLKISGTIHVTGTVLGTPVDQTLATTLYLAQNIGPVKVLASITKPGIPGPTSTSVLTGSTFLLAAETAIASSILPSSRSVQVPTAATAFLNILNVPAPFPTATQCGLGALLTSVNPLPGTFAYQTTDCANNTLTGSPNTPVDIPPAEGRCFVFAFTPSAAFAPTDLKVMADCTNTGPAPIIAGLTTLLLSASVNPVVDEVALAATIGSTGRMDIPNSTGTGVMAVATVNVGGAGGDITAFADTNSVPLPVTFTVCETTNQPGGACMAPPSPSVTTNISPNETNSFAVFGTASGEIAFNPATNRVVVRFQQSGVTRGSTSAAVCTDTHPTTPCP
jgi:hypothetical protein